MWVYGVFFLSFFLVFVIVDMSVVEYEEVLKFWFQVVRETWGLRAKRVHDYTLYTGALGTAYLLFKAYQVTKNENDLKLCFEIVKACDSASRESGYSLSLSLSLSLGPFEMSQLVGEIRLYGIASIV
jgi:hypothetical protein